MCKHMRAFFRSYLSDLSNFAQTQQMVSDNIKGLKMSGNDSIDKNLLFALRPVIREKYENCEMIKLQRKMKINRS